jgi:hypothetical protein
MGKVDRKPGTHRRVERAVHHLTRGGGLADNVTIIPTAGTTGTYGVYIAPANTPGVTIQGVSGGNGLAVFFDPTGGLNNTNGLGTFPGLFVRGCRQSSGTPPNVADGDTWYDTAVRRFICRESGQQFGVSGVMATSNTTSTGIGNSAAETVFSTHTFSVPANWWTTSRGLRFTCWGRYIAGGVNTCTLRAYLGTVVGLDFGAQALPVTGTSKNWRYTGIILPVTFGAGGTAMMEGQLNMQFNQLAQPICTNPTIAADTTIALAIKLTAQWSGASASDSIGCNGMVVENLG